MLPEHKGHFVLKKFCNFGFSALNARTTMTLLKLQGAIQHYDWGGTEFLPALLHLPNPDEKPFAEYWMGAHPKGESQILLSGHQAPLGEWIAQAPESRLGKEVAHRFGGKLPFLFKVLDVREMLSIQAHPVKEQAREGFARENAEGIPLDAPNRNYRDPNHKPELMVALSEFWLLHGFRSNSNAARQLRDVPEWSPLARAVEEQGLEGFYRNIMKAAQSEIDHWIETVATRIVPAYENGELSKWQPSYWAARAILQFHQGSPPYDRGLFSIFLLNLVNLQKGEGIFQGAGIPHAYLEGQTMEIMANSDNVFRGGLTHKYIDIPELLKTLVFDPVEPNILKGEKVAPCRTTYPVPVPDFTLDKIVLQARETCVLEAAGPEILFVFRGEAAENAGGQTLTAGQAFFAPAGETYSITGKAERTVAYRASCQ